MEHLVWNPVLPVPALLGGAALLAGLAVAAAWRSRAAWRAWANLAALGLRLAVLACALTLATRPEWLSQETLTHRPGLVLLVDDTQSLRLAAHPGGPPRAELGSAALAALLPAAAARGWEVRAFDAGVQLAPRTLDDRVVHARAPASPLGELLAETPLCGGEGRAFPAAEDAQIPQLGACVLVSDGCVNRGRPLAQPAAWLGARRIPFFAVVLGEEQPPAPDVALADAAVRLETKDEGNGAPAVESVRVGQAAIVTGRAQLLLTGAPPAGQAETWARLQVTAPHDVEPVPPQAQRCGLRPAPGWQEFGLGFTPQHPGLYRLRLALDALPGERNLTNNVAHLTLEVLPPRRRASFIASRLGYDFRALKALFSSWDGPAVETVPDFGRARAADGGRAERPAEEHLARWLDDSVPEQARRGTLIWEDPDPERLETRLQGRLRAAVVSGELGLVWVVDEPAEVLARRLRGTPLEGLFLYTTLQAAAAGAPGPVSATPAALDHPVTRFAVRSAWGAEPWRTLGPLQAWGGFSAPLPGTTVLLVAGDRPLLSAGRCGQGRVALLASGESWRWLLPPGEDAVARSRNALAGELWRRLIAWASGQEEQDAPPVRLFLAKERWELGEAPRARVAVRFPPPSRDIRVEYALIPFAEGARPPAGPWLPFGGSSTAEAGPAGEVPNASLTQVYSGSLAAPAGAGEWAAWVRAVHPGGAEIGADHVPLLVVGSPLEELSVSPDVAGLKAAVDAAGPGGRLVKPEAADLAALIEELDARLKPTESLHEARRQVLGAPPLVALLALALLGDIWLRRRR